MDILQSSSNSLRLMDEIVATWQRFIRIARDPYRPELHYMRGPGPKWHAKHGIRTESGRF